MSQTDVTQQSIEQNGVENTAAPATDDDDDQLATDDPRSPYPSRSEVIRRAAKRQDPDIDDVPRSTTRQYEGSLEGLFDEDGSLIPAGGLSDEEVTFTETALQIRRADVVAADEAEDEWEPDVDVETDSKACPECGCEDLSSYQQQTGGADEGMTSFNKCTECGHQWRGGYGG